MTNGPVYSVARSGGTIYIGGAFTRVERFTGSGVPIDAATGEPTSIPKVEGIVRAVAPDGAGGWYVGGQFTQVGGTPRSNLAHIAADGSVLAWNPPSNYADNATLDPFRDLDHYEVYVRQDGNFTDTDLPVALVAAVKDAPAAGGNPGGKILENEFILNNIQQFIGAGDRHYVSLKAVGVDGQRSRFMPPVLWDTI